DKTDYHARIEAPEMRDYGVYLKCDQLLACQKPLAEMVNADELQFQIVHQVEELWMKLIAYTLVDVLDYLEKQNTHRIVTLMGRVHRLMRMMTFRHAYLDGRGLTVADIYDEHYDHGDAYVVAEALIEFDELFQKFRANHLYLIHRSIGLGSKSLKGRPVEMLEGGARHRFFPELWDIRCDMTDRWGAEYGTVRDSISHPAQVKAG
ncbi:MAG: tryptophan 2,3-dioxygenase, partial [Mesorhizobium sp.]